MSDLGLVAQELENTLKVVSPLGVSVKLGKVYKDWPLILEDRKFSTDLIVSSISEFDIILGID